MEMNYSDESNAFDDILEILEDKPPPQIAREFVERCQAAIEDGETDSTLGQALREKVDHLTAISGATNVLLMAYRNRPEIVDD